MPFRCGVSHPVTATLRLPGSSRAPRAGPLKTPADVQAATPVLLRALDDPDAQVRIVAAELLLELDPKTIAAQRTLIAELRCREAGIRVHAVADLEVLGPALAQELVSQLQEMTKD